MSGRVGGYLAHEIGHYKLGHIPKMIAVSALSTFALFAVLGGLSQSDWLTRAFFNARQRTHLYPCCCWCFVEWGGQFG